MLQMTQMVENSNAKPRRRKGRWQVSEPRCPLFADRWLPAQPQNAKCKT